MVVYVFFRLFDVVSCSDAKQGWTDYVITVISEQMQLLNHVFTMLQCERFVCSCTIYSTVFIIYIAERFTNRLSHRM